MKILNQPSKFIHLEISSPLCYTHLDAQSLLPAETNTPHPAAAAAAAATAPLPRTAAGVCCILHGCSARLHNIEWCFLEGKMYEIKKTINYYRVRPPARQAVYRTSSIRAKESD